MQSIRGVIFDMDGVLCDSEPLHMRAWQQVLGPYGISVTTTWLAQWVGVADSVFAGYCVREYGVELSPEALLARKRDAYREITERELTLFPGVKDGIEWLHAHGILLAVATSSIRVEAERNLTRLGVLDYLTALVTANDVERLKPAPDAFLLAAERLGLAPDECAAFEDSAAGVAAAREAGCRVLAVLTTHAQEQLVGANDYLSDPAAALAFLRAQLIPATL
ncbi:MAG: HAD family hydrolase [Armatimonadota bacterium]